MLRDLLKGGDEFALRVPRPLAPAFDLAYNVAAYVRVFGAFPRLVSPRTFNEHVTRKKLYDRRPLLTQLADKYAVRQYVNQRVGEAHLTRLYLVADDSHDLNLDCLPECFVVKATHGSGWTIFVLDKSAADIAAIRNRCARWLSLNFYDMKREWAYRDIKPRIMVEEFLGDERGVAPVDYKFSCFYGVAQFVEVHVGRFGEWSCDYYDRDWRWLDVRQGVVNCPRPLPRPENLEEMIHVAEALAAGLDYVRVDLYAVGGRVVLGEMTHYPARGLCPFEPAEWDLIFGRYWSAGPA